MAKATPVTSTPAGYILVDLNGTARPWRLTTGALKEIKANLGVSIFAAFSGAIAPEDAIPVILSAGFNAARKYDAGPPADPFTPADAEDVTVGDLLRVAESIAAELGTFFGVNIPLLKEQVGAWLNDLLAGVAGPSGMSLPLSGDTSGPAETPTASGD